MPGTFMFAERTALERKGEMDEEYEVNHGEEEKKKGGGGGKVGTRVMQRREIVQEKVNRVCME